MGRSANMAQRAAGEDAKRSTWSNLIDLRDERADDDRTPRGSRNNQNEKAVGLERESLSIWVGACAQGGRGTKVRFVVAPEALFRRAITGILFTRDQSAAWAQRRSAIPGARTKTFPVERGVYPRAGIRNRKTGPRASRLGDPRRSDPKLLPAADSVSSTRTCCCAGNPRPTLRSRHDRLPGARP